MKKIKMIMVLLSLILVSGCTGLQEGKYNTGTYFGFDEDSKYTATIYVNEEGLIKSVLIDAAYGYKNENGSITVTTKRILGDQLEMKKVSDIDAEWYTQVDRIANKVIQEQGIGWLEFKYKTIDETGKILFVSKMPEGTTESDKVYTDTVSGVTIEVSDIYKAMTNALEQAQK